MKQDLIEAECPHCLTIAYHIVHGIEFSERGDEVLVLECVHCYCEFAVDNE